MVSEDINSLLPDTEGFPVGEGIKVIRGKTLAKTGSWLKALLLVNVGDKKQLRFYGWQKDKEGNYKVRQKFNVSKGYAATVGEIMLAFDEMD
jgi:hypothetical protein